MITTKKMGDLVDPNIHIEEKSKFSEFVRRNLFKANVHTGRKRGIFSLPKKFGVETDMLGESGQVFYSGHFNEARVSILPAESTKALNRLEAQLRLTVENMSIVDGYIPATSYEVLCRKFQEIRREYMAERDRLVSMWDIYVKDFKEGAEALLNSSRGFTQPERESVLKALFRGIPSKESFKDSFYMELDIVAFPAVDPPEGLNQALSAAIAAGAQNELYSFAIRAIETLIGETWSRLSSAANAYATEGRVHGRTLNAFCSLSDELAVKNVFGNRILSEMRVTLRKISEEENADVREDMVEDAMLEIWHYAKDSGIDLDLKLSPWTEVELSAMYAVREWTEKNIVGNVCNVG